MTARLPYGGQTIADLRSQRKRPAEMVLVSLIGPLRESNPVVIARPERTYDWRFLVGLEVLLVTALRVPAEQTNRVKLALLDVQPDYLGVWFVDAQDGVNVAFGSWRPKSKTCRMMGAAERRNLAGIGEAA